MTLPKDNPTNFCKAFIQREVDSSKEKSILMTYWPVMQSMVKRANELKLPYKELVDTFGYSDKFEGISPENSYIWLTLEHIWYSLDFRKEDIVKARKELKELKALKDDIADLAFKLSSKLTRQTELYETSGFAKPEYQFIDDLFEQASARNYLYQSHVSDKIKSLTGQYDLKYWPSRAELLTAIAEFEEGQTDPGHYQYPEHVISGRESDIKDFVLAFDSRFDEKNGLPTDFRFSNNAMADIINVVLDLPINKLATCDAVRNVRSRFKES